MENDILKILEFKLKNNTLTLDDIEKYEYMLKRCKEEINLKGLTDKLRGFIGRTDETYDLDKIKVTNYGLYNSVGENIEQKEKVEININNVNLTVKYEMVNEVSFTSEGATGNLVFKFLIDEYLILKRGQTTKVKEIINLTYAEELIKKLNISISLYEFLSAFLMLLNTNNKFEPLIQKVSNVKDREKYFFMKDWDSDSNISSDDEKETE